MKKPRIGISCLTGFNSEVQLPQAYLRLSYVESVVKAQGLPLLIPPGVLGADTEAVLDAVDGLFLIGGSDIAPEVYGETPIKECQAPDRERDGRELALTRAAAARNLPILAICRGVQLLNVAFGGTLFQDIDTQYKQRNSQARIVHNPNDFPECFTRVAHPIDLISQSQLAEILGVSQIRANSIHHQAIKDVAPSFRVNARAADGVIEGIEHLTLKFCMGVQSHPEEFLQVEPGWMKLFERFIEVCRTSD